MNLSNVLSLGIHGDGSITNGTELILSKYVDPVLTAKLLVACKKKNHKPQVSGGLEKIVEGAKKDAQDVLTEPLVELVELKGADYTVKIPLKSYKYYKKTYKGCVFKSRPPKHEGKYGVVTVWIGDDLVAVIGACK